MDRMLDPEFSIIIETFNVIEGTSFTRWLGILQIAQQISEQNNGEVLVADTNGASDIKQNLETKFPQTRHVMTSDHSYDAAKAQAAEEAEATDPKCQ